MSMNALVGEFEVALQINNLKTPPTFRDLVIILDGRINRNEISKSLDRLNDLGLIKENYIQRNGRIRREINISSEAKPLLEKIQKEVIQNGAGKPAD